MSLSAQDIHFSGKLLSSTASLLSVPSSASAPCKAMIKKINLNRVNREFILYIPWSIWRAKLSFVNKYPKWKITEKENNGKRFGLVFDVDGRKKHLLSNASYWEETHSERIQRQDFIEDGKLVHTTKRAEINNEGKMELVFDLSVSFTVDKQGNVIREAIYSLPNKNIKITIVMWTLRCVCEGQT